MEIKKSEKADLRNSIMTYVLAGLAFMLLLSWRALEIETKEVVITEEEEDEIPLTIEEEDIPIMQMLDTPPPPPPPPQIPEKIEIVENEKEIVEEIIAPTEVKQQEEVKIVKVEAVRKEVGVVDEIADVPFAVIENVPIYPGCEGKKNNDDRKKCMSDKITAFVNKNFNTGLANELGLEGRQQISVQFKIDKNGEVVGVASKAKNPGLEKEAERVIAKLPKMTPGKQRGKPVGVIYGLPIIFQVQD